MNVDRDKREFISSNIELNGEELSSCMCTNTLIFLLLYFSNHLLNSRFNPY